MNLPEMVQRVAEADETGAYCFHVGGLQRQRFEKMVDLFAPFGRRVNLALKQSPPGLTHAYMMVADLAGAPSGAIAPLIGGWMMDVFAAKHFAVTFQWSGQTTQLSAYVL